VDRALAACWRALLALRAAERALAMALVALIVVVITAQVFTRYAFGRPIVWVEDVATFAFIWAVFLGAAVGLKDLRHVRIATFLGRLPVRAAALAQAGLYTVVLGCCAVVALFALGVMETESRSLTISLPVNLPRHLFYSVPLFCSLASMALTALYLVAAYLAKAATGRTLDAEAAAAARADRERALDEAEARIAEAAR
jgi:TRAP-type C4-dicarboxylate transport system permease small subunit